MNDGVVGGLDFPGAPPAHDRPLARKHRIFEEKLQIREHIWYKVSRSERV